MIGAIIGDVGGSIYEFNNTFDYNMPLLKDGSTFTDDSICTIAIADALNRKISYKESLLEWCKKYPHPSGGYGMAFYAWINSKDPKPYNSFGNGSAMRVSPVAWAFDNLKAVLREAEKTAEITHNHPEGIKGAVAVAHAIYHLRKTKDLPSIQDIAMQYYPNFLNDTFQPGQFNETCQGTVPIAFKILLSSTNFEDAIRKAISWGGDSDTLGAIVGSMAEAYFEIPKQMISATLALLPDEMRNVIYKFNEQLINKQEKMP